MSDSIRGFTACWLSHAWSPPTIQADHAFKNADFCNFCEQIGSKLQFSPPRRHNKNLLEPKHGVIRSIFNRLKEDKPDADPATLAYQAVIVSNDLYGTDTVSAFELYHGFTKPIDPAGHKRPLPSSLIEAHDNLRAKRKLNLILRSKSIF